MRFRIIIYILFFLPGVAWTSEEGTIPIRFVCFQVLNFSLFAIALFYLLRKKLPIFLKQKQQDFLEYRRKAKQLEHEHQQACLFLEQEIETLVKKQEKTQENVKKALEDLKMELKDQEKEWLDNFKKRTAQELKRQEIKQLENLKTRLLSKVMEQTEVQLQEKIKAGSLDQLSYQGMQKWEGV